MKVRISQNHLAHVCGLFRLMRPKQWIKNAFVLAPLMFAARFFDPLALLQALCALLLFCVASSAAYIVNDMWDIESDRRHPSKSKTRPLAAGCVPLSSAVFLLVALYGVLICGAILIPQIIVALTAYIALNLAYTFFLKYQPVIDIFAIAIGFVLRLYGGAMAIAVPVSEWMLITTLCLALYLAAIKRHQELSHNGSGSRDVLEKYSIALIDKYAQISATGALVFYSLFVMTTKLQMVWTIPLVLYGLFRYWYIVQKLDGESPTDVLFADWQLLLTILLWIGMCGVILWSVKG